MPPSDLPNLAEILEREAVFENHIFMQEKKKKNGYNCTKTTANSGGSTDPKHLPYHHMYILYQNLMQVVELQDTVA